MFIKRILKIGLVAVMASALTVSAQVPKPAPKPDEHEVEKFVCIPRAGVLRVRWKGYKSADDTEETVKGWIHIQLGADLRIELASIAVPPEKGTGKFFSKNQLFRYYFTV